MGEVDAELIILDIPFNIIWLVFDDLNRISMWTFYHLHLDILW